jgi:hypothetical protein
MLVVTGRKNTRYYAVNIQAHVLPQSKARDVLFSWYLYFFPTKWSATYHFLLT